MELSIIKGPQLVIALDIGSTYSGYAWQQRSEFETNRNNIHFNTIWGAGSLQLHKTTTCLLLKVLGENEIEGEDTSKKDTGSSYENELNEYKINSRVETKIGQEAERAYNGLAKMNQPHELIGRYYFFKRFKTVLYNKNFNRVIEDQIDQPLKLFDVMSLFIRTLKDHCIKKLQTKSIGVDLNKTLFVVTVPAIWSDEAKKFMRDASIKAGIGKKNLILALEPEAAAIYCLHLPEEQRKEMNDIGMTGQKFLVADLGGGTADLSAVQVTDEGYLKELCPPLGKPVGGQKINEAFLQACHDTFDGDAWTETFGKATPIEMMNMEADFERKKVAIGTNDPDGELIDLEVPKSVLKGLSDKSIQLKDSKYLRLTDSEFMFDSALIRNDLFKETCKIVYGAIKGVLETREASELKAIVLVGGFAESPIVVENIRQMIANDFSDTKIVVPSSPFKAVLMGAVLFGHNPMIFRSRISRATFGIQTNVKFDSTKHDESKQIEHRTTGEKYCEDIFHVHVRKGKSVVLGNKQPVETYLPMYENQNRLTLPIYKSSSVNPKYTDEAGCKQLGKITVDFANAVDDSEKRVEVAMVYGGTELSVIARDKASGKEYEADISFSNIE